MTNELDIVRQAILNEEEGAAFYSLAAEKTADQNVQEAFEYLRDQELLHSQWIRSVYNRTLLKAETGFNLKAELSKLSKSPGIFSAKAPAFKLAVMDMAVFAAGILIEKASIDFYQKAIREAESQEVKKLFTELANWENDHLEQLQTIHEALSTEWLDQFEFTHSPKL